MRYPNLVWAISEWGTRYKFAADLGESESWLSRRLNGRVELSERDRERIAGALEYPAEWLFMEPIPPTVGRAVGTSNAARCTIAIPPRETQ